MSTSIFYGVMGTPFQSDLVTTLFRMVEESLRQGHTVVVWCCGYATILSQTTIERRPDIFDPDTDREGTHYPSTSEMITALRAKYGDRFSWYVCDYCMKERGAVSHVSCAEVKIPFSYYYYLNKAEVSLVLGVKS